MGRWEGLLLAAWALSVPAFAGVPRLTLSLQPVVLADDDGSRQAQITGVEIGKWVGYANRVWKAANIVLEQKAPAISLRSTLLNSMMGEADPDWDRERQEANAVAGRFQGKLVVFFRYGPGTEPTRQSFSWTDVNFIVMSGYRGNVACGQENISLLAHEIGHYLGLAHPFNRSFPTLLEAERHFRSSGGKPEIFDNDGLDDTPPAPFVRGLQCSADASMTLAGVSFRIPRDNVMSYYYPPGPHSEPRHLTPQQIAWSRRVAELRLMGAGPLPANPGGGARIEFEDLATEASDGVQTDITTASGSWSAGSFVFCRALARGWMEVPLRVERSGRYRLELYGALGPDYGNMRVLLDGRRVGPDVRGWAPLVTPTGPIRLAFRKLTAGTHSLRFVVSGKDTASKGFNFGLDCLRLEPD